MAAVFDVKSFWSRLGQIFTAWEKGGKAWGAAEDSSSTPDAIAIVTGSVPDGISYTRSGALQTHLFGYAVSDSVFIFTKADKCLHIMCTAKRQSFFQPAGSSDPTNTWNLKLHEKVKGDPETDAAAALAIVKAATASAAAPLNGTVGVLLKDKPLGQYAGRVRKVLLEDSRLALSDVAAGFGNALLVKDAAALASIRAAATVAATVLHKVGMDRASRFAADDKPVTHLKWSSVVEKALTDGLESVPGLKESGLDLAEVEVAVPPLIQSGAESDLRPLAEPSEARIDYDTMVMGVGARYKSYCAYAGRTLFIEPTEEHEAAYTLLLDVAAACAAKLTPGTRAREVYETAEALVRDRRPEWVEKLTKNCGTGIGLELREAAVTLSSSSAAVLAEGMTVNLCIGLGGVKPGKKNNDDGKRKPFSVFLADTYVVRAPSTDASVTAEGPECLTASVPRKFASVSLEFDDEDDEEDASAAAAAPAAASARGAGSSDRGSRAKRAQDEAAARANEEEERRQQQRDLAAKRAEEALERYANHDGVKSASDAQAQAAARIRAYKTPSAIPEAARPNRLQVDRGAKAVLVPLNGVLVPFHVSLVKSVRRQEMGQHVVLRIQFHTPDAKGTLESLPPGSDPGHAFLKEVSFRSKAPSAFSQVYTQLEVLRKEAVAAKKDAEAGASGGALVEQPALRVLAQPEVRLREVSCRPAIGSGTGTRKSPGVLTAHANGLRYMAKDRDGTAHVDIIYSNIKSCFVQRASARDSQVVLHLELKDAIKIGTAQNKKSSFLQFFYEVADTAQDVSTANARYDDEDEMRAEREEERRRDEWNGRFAQFAEGCDKMWDKAGIDMRFEKPYRKLMFTGVASKENVEMFPTTSCLIALEDRPRPLVVAINEIELASLERVNFNQREFDMVLIYKDYSRVPTSINSVPMKYLDAIKSWLNAVGVLYHEFPSNIRWSEVLPEILKDVRGFFEDGGWATLMEGDSDEEGGEGGSDSDSAAESGSEYEASESESEESDEFTSDNESDSEEGSGGSSSEYDEEEDEDALDWDELEEKTKKEEKTKSAKKGKGRDSDSDSD